MTTAFAYTLAAALALPVHKEDLGDPRVPALRAAVALEVSRLKPPAGVDPKDWRALVLAVGAAETHLSPRIIDGHCRPWECDRGRSRSGWQLQRNLHTAPVWERLQGFENLHVQVATADAMLKRAYYQCRGARSVVWIDPVVLAYAGRGCRNTTIEPWKGLPLRRQYWVRARQAMG